MPQLHLPVQHSDEDLVLAGALASMLKSKHLYVAYSLDSGPAEPIVPASIQEPEPRAPRQGWLRRLLGPR